MAKGAKWTPEENETLLSCTNPDGSFNLELALTKFSHRETRPETLSRRWRKLRQTAPAQQESEETFGGWHGKFLLLQEQHNQLRSKMREQSKRNASVEAMVEAIEETVPTRDPVPVPKPLKVNGDVDTEDVVLCLGDFHYGEVVDPEETGGIAVYNIDVAQARLEHTIDTAIKMAKEKLRGGYHLPRLYVFGLGDWVSGIIHDELEISNEVQIVSQVLESGELLEEALLKLCQHFEEVIFVGVVGNHGRVKQERYFKGKAINNYDFLVYKMVAKALKNQPNLTMRIPKSFWHIEAVQGHRYLLMHGDVIRQWMGMPWYGMQREYLKWRALAESFVGGFDDLVIGHFHNPNIVTIQRDEIIVNGAFKGGDDYSLGIGVACDPIQLMWGVHPRRGRTWTFQINSADIR